MEVLAPMVIVPLFFLSIAWGIGIVLKHRRVVKLSRLQAEMHEKTMEKLAGSEEVLEYLRSDMSFKFADVAPTERKYPYTKILSSIQIGIVLALSGVTFLLLRNTIAEAFEAFSFLGALALALGVAFLLSATVSWRLSKSWGLLNGGGEEESGERF
jgi:hypothetical protein